MKDALGNELQIGDFVFTKNYYSMSPDVVTKIIGFTKPKTLPVQAIVEICKGQIPPYAFKSYGTKEYYEAAPYRFFSTTSDMFFQDNITFSTSKRFSFDIIKVTDQLSLTQRHAYLGTKELP